MSRWSDDFEKHPIHQLISNTCSALDVELDTEDLEFENERQRLLDIMEMLKDIIEGLNREFYPKQLLDQINQHLSHQNFNNRIANFSNNPDISYLKVANDHISAFAPQIYQLAAMARNPEPQEIINASKKALVSFKKVADNKTNGLNYRVAKNQKLFTEIEDKVQKAEQKIDAITAATDTRLVEWQKEFTDQQTNRAEEHSKAHIEREKSFETQLSEFRKSLDEQQEEIIKKTQDTLEGTLDAFKTTGKEALDDVNAKHQAVLEIHKLVGRDSVAGGYQKSAGEEKEEANKWRWISFACLLSAVGWLGFKYWSGFSTASDGTINWPEFITTASLTAVLLATAGYTAKQSKLHRDNEKQLRSYALETKALGPFIADLEPSEQRAIKSELVRRMFGQQNSQSSSKDKQDSETVRALVEKLPDTITDTLKKITDKTSH